MASTTDCIQRNQVDAPNTEFGKGPNTNQVFNQGDSGSFSFMNVLIQLLGTGAGDLPSQMLHDSMTGGLKKEGMFQDDDKSQNGGDSESGEMIFNPLIGNEIPRIDVADSGLIAVGAITEANLPMNPDAKVESNYSSLEKVGAQSVPFSAIRQEVQQPPISLKGNQENIGFKIIEPENLDSSEWQTETSPDLKFQNAMIRANPETDKSIQPLSMDQEINETETDSDLLNFNRKSGESIHHRILSSSDFSLSKPASSTEPENYAAITNLKTQKSGEEGKPDVSIIQQSSSNGLSVLKNPPDLNADIGTGDGVFANLAGSAEMKQADEVIIKLEEAGTNILSDLRDKKIKLSNKGPDEAEKDKGKTAQTAISSTEQSKINSASDFVEFTDSPKNPNASVDSTEKIFNKELGISGSKNTIHKNDGSHTLVKDMSIGFTSASAVATGDAEQHVGEIRPQTVINQVIDTVQSAISKGYSRIRMEVNPASLGSLDMDLLVNQDRVKMIIFADNQEVRNLLQSNMDQLKTSLQQQGLRMEGVEVFVQDRSAGNGHNPNGNYYGQGFHGLEHPRGNNRNEKPRESEMSHGQLVSDRNRNATGLSIFV